MRALAAATWKHRRATVAALVLLIVAKIAAVSVPLVLKRIVDDLGPGHAALALPLGLLLGYALLRFSQTLFGELRDLIFSRVTQRTVADFMLAAFSHLHALGPRYHGVRHTGALIREVERGTGAVGFLLGVALFTIVPTFIEIGAVVVILVAGYSIWFTLVIASTFALYAALTSVLTERRARHQRALNDLDSTASGRLVDSLLNYETVRFYANERFEARQLDAILRRWIGTGVKTQEALSLLHVGQSGVIALGVAAVMVIAGLLVVHQRMTVGDLVLVNAYILQVCLPLNSLGFVFRESKDAFINAERLFSLMRQEPEIEDAAQSRELEVESGELRFENVTFSYEPGRTILQDVWLTVPAGKTVAVVGGSGSGKSTLARLLFRFYDVDRGRILIDGQDVRTVTQKSLRRSLGIVPQDTILFNTSIGGNIEYGRVGASRADVESAARAARLHEFISALPSGYDTPVGERGLKLSGGERQRVAIARALLKNPPILVFDEATSALDTRAERAIQEELERMAAQRTTLVIAHRLSTVVNAHQIVVLEHGRIVERGRHAELLAQGGLYAQMWALQQQEVAIEQAGRRLTARSVDLATMLAGIVDSLRPLLDAKGLNLYSLIGADTVRVTADPGALQQVIWDLCVNAIRVTPPRGRVELSLERVAVWARLSITDSRTQADARRDAATAAADRTFEEVLAYESAQAPFDPDLVRSVVEEHEGRLVIEPRASGEGVVYRIELPLRAVLAPEGPEGGAAEEAAPAAAAPASTASLAGYDVLLIDDQHEALDLLSGVLSLHGAATRTFDSGAAALYWLEKAPSSQWPTVVVCDIALGDEDGYAVLQSIRRIEAERGTALAARVPAIALTGYARAEDRTRALMAGFQVHLVKPVDPAQLVSTIASLSSPRSRHDAVQPA